MHSGFDTCTAKCWRHFVGVPEDSMDQQSHLLRRFGPCQRFSCSGVGLHKHRGRNQCHITSTAKLPARSSCEAETPLRPGQTTPDRVEMAVAKHEANPGRAAPRRTQHDESLCHASKTLTSCAVASPAGACKCSFSSCSSMITLVLVMRRCRAWYKFGMPRAHPGVTND